MLLDLLVVTVVHQPFTAEGCIEKDFSFTKGFETAKKMGFLHIMDFVTAAVRGASPRIWRLQTGRS